MSVKVKFKPTKPVSTALPSEEIRRLCQNAGICYYPLAMAVMKTVMRVVIKEAVEDLINPDNPDKGGHDMKT